MAGTIKLDSEKLESSIGILMKNGNEDVLASVDELAALMRSTGDSNPLVEQTLEACIKFQSTYNSYHPSLEKVVQGFKDTFDMNEWLSKRASVGELKNRDLGINTVKMDTSKFV